MAAAAVAGQHTGVHAYCYSSVLVPQRLLASRYLHGFLQCPACHAQQLVAKRCTQHTSCTPKMADSNRALQASLHWHSFISLQSLKHT